MGQKKLNYRVDTVLANANLNQDCGSDFAFQQDALWGGKRRALEERERQLVVLFGGQISQSCCAADYFEDLALILRDSHGVDYAAWECSPSGKLGRNFVATYARLDFLGELRGIVESIRPRVEDRLREFEAIGRRMDPREIFSELCFCILTANYTAEGGSGFSRA